MDFWASIGLGAGFGLAYIALSLLTHRIARKAGRLEIQVELVGIGARLLMALIGVTIVLLALPVVRGAFVLAFLATFTLGLVFDTIRAVRRAARASLSRPA